MFIEFLLISNVVVEAVAMSNYYESSEGTGVPCYKLDSTSELKLHIYNI